MNIFHGFHMDSMWNMFGLIMEWKYSINSTWIPHGMDTFHIDSIWNRHIPSIPHGMDTFHSFHMESTWNKANSVAYSIHSTWIPYGMDTFHLFHMESTWNKVKSVDNLILYKIF